MRVRGMPHITSSLESARQHLLSSPYITKLLQTSFVMSRHFAGIHPSVDGILSRCSALSPSELEMVRVHAKFVLEHMGHQAVHFNYVLFTAPLQASFTVGDQHSSTAFLACLDQRLIYHETVHMIQRAFPMLPGISWVRVPNSVVEELIERNGCVDNPDSSVTQYPQYAYAPVRSSQVVFVLLYTLDLDRVMIPIDRVSFRQMGPPARPPHGLDDPREMEAVWVANRLPIFGASRRAR